ncbi:cAMP-binding domain of CRP or a regulatory subunit of cAMP-dependent protein kinases [Flavobacterium resistens]|uniref:Cyclic nucleotide-binding domain-containing protein n=1 Tax=Flavobacterium resistens TaxID=443612 RepID=A0A521DMM9_9FLAO|nr:Crp/Fnr family transcriptional regulator [Flavobacterium resistens]MRX68796.1 cyclic nucleotide-binding domain-containing protein [Flavobacterium resistens]SMO72200.1 cAMP-binding domain of CRP or a regulatory subunit of cAMP-dependent protein kinases [Flavobacterium resistens]
MDGLKKHIEEITPITNEEFDYIKTFFKEKKVKKHQYLLQDGDKVTSEYWIVKGIFRAFHIDKDGKEHILQFALENWWFSDYNAFFSQKESNINIVCMDDAEVLCLTLSGREQLASEFHKMEHFFRMKLTSGYSAQQRRIISLLSNNPKKRYEEFASLYPNIMQKIPKKYIAEYLGVSRETLSRLYSTTSRD